MANRHTLGGVIHAYQQYDPKRREKALRTLAATWIQIIPAEQSGPRIAGTVSGA